MIHFERVLSYISRASFTPFFKLHPHRSVTMPWDETPHSLTQGLLYMLLSWWWPLMGPALPEDDLEAGSPSVSVPEGQSMTVTTRHHCHSPSSFTVAAGVSVHAAQVASMIWVP